MFAKISVLVVSVFFSAITVTSFRTVSQIIVLRDIYSPVLLRAQLNTIPVSPVIFAFDICPFWWSLVFYKGSTVLQIKNGTGEKK